MRLAYFHVIDNEVDGFALLNLGEANIMSMFPGKIAIARKIITLLNVNKTLSPSASKLHTLHHNEIPTTPGCPDAGGSDFNLSTPTTATTPLSAMTSSSVPSTPSSTSISNELPNFSVRVQEDVLSRILINLSLKPLTI